MSWWKRLLGGKRDDEAREPDPLPIAEEIARWAMERRDDGTRMLVSYGTDALGRYLIMVTGGDSSMAEFLEYYLDDPLNARPVYIHGRGHQNGPHTRDPEQFDVAMSILPITFTAYETYRLPLE